MLLLCFNQRVILRQSAQVVMNLVLDKSLLNEWMHGWRYGSCSGAVLDGDGHVACGDTPVLCCLPFVPALWGLSWPLGKVCSVGWAARR